MRHFRTVMASALMTCTALAGAYAAETVFSDGAARACYEVAQFGGDIRAGVATCTAALDSNTLSLGDRASTFINRGIVKSRIPDYRGALADYDTGLTMRPDLAEAYVDRGAVLIMVKRYNDAIADLTKGIELNSRELHVAYFDRGLVRERMHDLKGACADYRQALVLEPGFALATSQLGICPKQIEAPAAPSQLRG